MLIELNDIHKTFPNGNGGVGALKGVSLGIDRGEFVAIMGPSGSGKSTLMNIVGCLLRPTSGEYRLEGQRVNDLDDARLAHLRNHSFGFVFQLFNLLPRLSAIENVRLPLQYANGNAAGGEERVRQVLEWVGMVHRASHRSNEMSGGECQRVAIARALVTQPDVILADEPTGSLDSGTRGEIMGIFHRLHAEGRTIILVTHDADTARYARRVVTVRDGLIVRDEPGGQA